jgi:hypothetical protein
VAKFDDRQVVFWLHTKEDPPQQPWEDALKMLSDIAKKIGDRSKLVSICVTDGGAPNTLQRRQFNEALEGGVQSAVVTTVLSNPIKRGVATALLCLNPGCRAVQPSDFDRALQYLSLEDRKPAIIAEFRRLQANLPPNESLKLIFDTLR